MKLGNIYLSNEDAREIILEMKSNKVPIETIIVISESLKTRQKLLMDNKNRRSKR